MTEKRQRNDWERRKDPVTGAFTENVKRFQAFKIYRDMGRDRSFSKVSKELEKSVTLLSRWSSEDGWVARCEKYDEYVDKTEALSAVEDAKQMGKRHVMEGKLLQAKAIEKIKTLTIQEISPSVAVQMLRMGVDIERLARGEPTLISETSLSELTITERMKKYTNLFGNVTDCNNGDEEDGV